MPTFAYPAIRYQQLASTSDGKPRSIICLTAPCDEILSWAGIPRKVETLATADSDDTVPLHGYQRAKDDSRIQKLVEFYQNPSNVVPTSLLLATRDDARVKFVATGPTVDFGSSVAEQGTITIEYDVDRIAKFSDLLARLAKLLESRHSALAQAIVPTSLVDYWKGRLVQTDTEKNTVDENGSPDAENEEDEEEDEDSSAVNPYHPDSHIEDFYREIMLRRTLCAELPYLNDRDEVLGITRQMVLDYLAPATVVDGQHRLLGATESLDFVTSEYLESPEAEQRLIAGESGEEIDRQFRKKARRVFSATLLDDSDWAEHVFHFVVVNQKVKPIPKVLLSSIIGTSLNAEEIERIQNRLSDAGIAIDDYRVMARLTEDSQSPFFGVVKRGYTASAKKEAVKLDWSVVNGLASDFRTLKSLQPFDRRVPGEVNPGTQWKQASLEKSPFIIAFAKSMKHEGDEPPTPREAWANAVNGAWLPVFFQFWKVAREKLSDDSNSRSSWQDPHSSNLFNGATMRCLLCDFVEYLFDAEFQPTDQSHFFKEIDEYFKKMKPTFFAKEWNIIGKRLDRANMTQVAVYLRNHRKTGKVDGKWGLFK